MREAPNAIMAEFARRDSRLRTNASLALELLERLAVIALCVAMMLLTVKVIDILTRPDPVTMTAQPSSKDYELLEARVDKLEKRLHTAEVKAYKVAHPEFKTLQSVKGKSNE